MVELGPLEYKSKYLGRAEEPEASKIGMANFDFNIFQHISRQKLTQVEGVLSTLCALGLAARLVELFPHIGHPHTCAYMGIF